MKKKKCSSETCRRAGAFLPLGEFHKDSSRKDGHNYYCNECEKKRNKEWCEKNPNKVKTNRERFFKNNPSYKKKQYEKIKNNLKYKVKKNAASKKHYKKHKDDSEFKANNNIRSQQHYKNNKLNKTMSNGMYSSLKGHKNDRHWENLVPYTLQQLKEYLESLFQEGMTWNNYGSMWHVDHIIPISLWKFEKPEDREFKQCWALCNLQPLWKKDNLKKGNRI